LFVVSLNVRFSLLLTWRTGCFCQELLVEGSFGEDYLCWYYDAVHYLFAIVNADAGSSNPKVFSRSDDSFHDSQTHGTVASMFGEHRLKSNLCRVLTVVT
jgi:hypothetical protein